MLFKAVDPTGTRLPEASFFNMSSIVLSTRASLNFFCVSDMLAYKIISFFLGKEISTSPFKRLNRNGFKIPCNLEMTFARLCCSLSANSTFSSNSSLKSNQLLNWSKDENTSGNKKCNKDHNSGKLFCNGVPVNSNLFAAGIIFNSRINLQSKFFNRCPSSTIKYLNWYFCKNLRSNMAISNDVTITGKLSSTTVLTGIRVFLISALSCLLPWYKTVGNAGQNFLNSLIQFDSVDNGPTTKNGPQIPLLLK